MTESKNIGLIPIKERQEIFEALMQMLYQVKDKHSPDVETAISLFLGYIVTKERISKQSSYTYDWIHGPPCRPLMIQDAERELRSLIAYAPATLEFDIRINIHPTVAMSLGVSPVIWVEIDPTPAIDHQGGFHRKSVFADFPPDAPMSVAMWACVLQFAMWVYEIDDRLHRACGLKGDGNEVQYTRVHDPDAGLWVWRAESSALRRDGREVDDG